MVEAAAAEIGLQFLPVIALGVILGFYELLLIHRDVGGIPGGRWFSHGLHCVGLMIIALFIIMNADYILAVTGLVEKIPEVLGLGPAWLLRIITAIILNIKMHGTSVAIKGRLSGSMTGRAAEHWSHTTLVTLLVLFAPLYWPFIDKVLPESFRIIP